MAAPKGHNFNPRGRGKGTPNKATVNAREAIARLVDGNAHRLNKWLDQIAAENPLDAFRCFMDICEYHIPKLARTEITGKDGEKLQINVVAGFGKPVIEAEFQEVKQIESKVNDENS